MVEVVPAHGYQPMGRAPGYKVEAVDGFVMAIIQKPGEAALQLSFWTVDGSPDSENNSVPYEDPGHYSITVKHTLQAAVKIKPDVAQQLAFAMLQALVNMPPDVRERYGLTATAVPVGAPPS